MELFLVPVTLEVPLLRTRPSGCCDHEHANLSPGMLTQHARRGKDFSSTTRKEKEQYAGRLVRAKERTAIDMSIVSLAQNLQWEKWLSVFARTGPFKRRVGRNRKGNKKLLFFQWNQIDPAEIDFCPFRLENNFPFSER